MVIIIQENGRMMLDKEMAYLYGQMVTNMKVIGVRIKKVVLEYIKISMEIIMKVNGLMIK